MSKDKFNFDYDDFDPDKEYDIKNDKVNLSHTQILHRSDSAERLKNRNKSDKGRETSSVRGKKNVEDGIFGGKGSMSQNALDSSGWYQTEELKDIMRVNRDPDAGWKALKEKGYYESEKYKEHAKKMSKKAHEVLSSKKDGYKNFTDAGLKESHKRVTCKHCGEVGDLNNIRRWHDNNCKEMPELMEPILDMLPEVFTLRQWKEAFKKTNHPSSPSAARVILNKSKKYAIKIHEGTYGSTKDVALYKKA